MRYNWGVTLVCVLAAIALLIFIILHVDVSVH